MGMYTGLRFKGIVKKEFRDEFGDIALNGNWDNSTDSILREFGNVSRAEFIPCGRLAYMPDEWYNDDEFDTTYDRETGRWTFQCSLKNYEDTIERFLEMVPYFIESVEHAEMYYEEWSYSSKFELIDGRMRMTNSMFIQYKDNYNDWWWQ